MSDPFKIDGPTAISFSGGRTSAYMLWRVLQSNGGLPDEARVCFANTGKEDEATLRFVQRCADEWGVPISWIEYAEHEDSAQRFRVVDFASASRNGEPLEAIIRRKNYLPNPVTRFCTVEAKIRAMGKYLKSLGWADDGGEWDTFIGIRADEQRRVAKIRARDGKSTETKHETMCIPLAEAGVDVHEVGEFWSRQPFNLELATHNGRTLAGNCDLCFLKPANQVFTLIQERPERALWWARMESSVQSAGEFKGNGARFRSDRPGYAEMLAYTKQQGQLFDEAEEMAGCFCGD